MGILVLSGKKIIKLIFFPCHVVPCIFTRAYSFSLTPSAFLLPYPLLRSLSLSAFTIHCDCHFSSVALGFIELVAAHIT